ncbi:MAG: lysoplasmalogenase family protein [Clostridiales bacterium]|jgi:hypothetical protein|nr:lysoplasmalogenase family protein [Clostridiales bacterium]
MLDKVFFAAVAALCALSLSYRSFAIDRLDAMLSKSAMAFTLAADFCMLVIYNNTAGLIFFCIVQTIYHARYARLIKTAPLVAFQVAAGVAAALGLSMLSLHYRLSAAYAAALIFSVSASVFASKKYPRPNRIITPLGMILFLLCDLFVGLYNLPTNFSSVFQIFIWVFYLPSQCLLAVSGMKMKSTEAKT